ncbi:MAG: FoF1 ATP synthase subunit a [Armatimonadota bacterium]
MAHGVSTATVATEGAHQGAQAAASHGGSIGEHAMGFCNAYLFGYKVHLDTLVYSWGIILLLIIIGFIAGRRSRIIPRPFQCMFEIIYNWVGGFAQSMMGPKGKNYIPFAMTIFLFILCANWIAMIPTFIPPSRDINTTVAYALVSFLGFTYYGMANALKKVKTEENLKGPKKYLIGFWRWFAHYFYPVPVIWSSMDGAIKYILCPFLLVLFFVLNIIEELARVLSLSIRLMGNVMGEHLALSVFLGLVVMAGQLNFITGTTKILVWFNSAFVTVIGGLTGFIQAMIFMVLSLSYIAHIVTEDH